MFLRPCFSLLFQVQPVKLCGGEEVAWGSARVGASHSFFALNPSLETQVLSAGREAGGERLHLAQLLCVAFWPIFTQVFILLPG